MNLNGLPPGSKSGRDGDFERRKNNLILGTDKSERTKMMDVSFCVNDIETGLKKCVDDVVMAEEKWKHLSIAVRREVYAWMQNRNICYESNVDLLTAFINHVQEVLIKNDCPIGGCRSHILNYRIDWRGADIYTPDEKRILYGGSIASCRDEHSKIDTVLSLSDLLYDISKNTLAKKLDAAYWKVDHGEKKRRDDDDDKDVDLAVIDVNALPLPTSDQIAHGLTMLMSRSRARMLEPDEIDAYDTKTEMAVLTRKGWAKVTAMPKKVPRKEKEVT